MERLVVKGFKRLRDVEIPLSRFTVIVGPNGVGKSTVLEVVGALAETFKFCVQSGSSDDAIRRNLPILGIAKNTDLASFEIKEFCIIKSTKNNQEYIEIVFKENNISKYENNNLISKLFQNIPANHPLLHSTKLQFNPAVISVPEATTKSPTLNPDGSNLGPLLDDLIGRRDGSIERIDAAMGALVHGFTRIYTEKEDIEIIENRILTIDGQAFPKRETRTVVGFGFSADIDGVRVPAAQMSEGTLLLLAIVTLLHSPRCPKLLLIDDLDRGLHPQAQVELVRLLRRLTQERPDLQIIATSHSPLVLTECSREEVVVLEFNGAETVVRAAEESPALMTPSEIVTELFDISRTGASQYLQEYALLAANPNRSLEDEDRLTHLRARLHNLGAMPDWEPVPRTPAP